MWICPVCDRIHTDSEYWCNKCETKMEAWACTACGHINDGVDAQTDVTVSECSSCGAEKPQKEACSYVAQKLEKYGKIALVISVLLAIAEAVMIIMGGGIVNAISFQESAVNFGSVITAIIVAVVTIFAGMVIRTILEALAIWTEKSSRGNKK